MTTQPELFADGPKCPITGCGLTITAPPVRHGLCLDFTCPAGHASSLAGGVR